MQKNQSSSIIFQYFRALSQENLYRRLVRKNYAEHFKAKGWYFGNAIFAAVEIKSSRKAAAN